MSQVQIDRTLYLQYHASKGDDDLMSEVLLLFGTAGYFDFENHGDT